MNKLNGINKEVPPTEHTFTIDVVGEVTRKRFVGEFTCKIPRRKDQCLIDKHRALLNGDLASQLEAATLSFHHMISYLRYTLTEMPKFWKDSDRGYELYDANVVKAIYDEVLNFEESWFKEVWGPEALADLRKPEDGDAEEKVG